MMRILLYISLLLLLSPGLRSQDMAPRTSHLVRVESSPEGAEVYQGDSLLGRTPLKVDGRNLGRMTAYFPSRNSWNAAAKKFPETAPSYLEGVLFLEFPGQLTLRTVPADAAVYLRRKLIGRTPLSISVQNTSDTVRISKPGFEAQYLVLHERDSDQINILLSPSPGFDPGDEVRSSKPSFRLPPTKILIAGAVGLAAGITAVMLKEQADRHYDRYADHGLAGDFDSSRRYDLISGIALAILELSIAYLLYEVFANS
jgi:PEGA domain